MLIGKLILQLPLHFFFYISIFLSLNMRSSNAKQSVFISNTPVLSSNNDHQYHFIKQEHKKTSPSSCDVFLAYPFKNKVAVTYFFVSDL